MIWIILGIICILLGLVAVILSKMWGLLLLLAGVGIIAFRYVFMMRGSGFNPDQGTLNGLNGQGKNQSEVVKEPIPGSGEQPANIWEMVEE